MFDITAIGEALIDLTQTGLSASGVAEYAANPGGAPANLAVAAAKLGASTAFIGRVGTDAFGTQLRECLRANGVDVSRMLTDAQRPTRWQSFRWTAAVSGRSPSIASIARIWRFRRTMCRMTPCAARTFSISAVSA